MKHFKVLISMIAISFAFAACGDDSSSSNDDLPALSGENLKVTELVDKAVGDSVNDALTPKKGKIVGKIVLADGEEEKIDYSNDDGSLKITGTYMDIKIVMKEYTVNITEENGTKHIIKMSGTLTKKENHDKESHNSVITKNGILDVTFDDADHTIGFDYTETEDYSKMDDEGNLPYTIEGSITFDGAEYSYKKSDKKNLNN